MRLPDDTNKYTAQFKYFEFAYYTEKAQKTGKPAVLRYVDEHTRDPKLYTLEEIYNIAAGKYKNSGVYYTIFQYAGNVWKKDLARLGSLYFDLDSKDISVSYSDTQKVYNHLKQYIPDDSLNVFFSGLKGFHVEVEAIALGVSVAENLPEVYKYIAHDLENKLNLTSMDYSVYDYRRIWRLPNTKHQKTGLYKVNCTELIRNGESIESIMEYAKEPHYINVPEQELNVKAHRWYRDYVYDYEKTLTPVSMDTILTFLESGTTNVKTFNSADRVFDYRRLKNNCPAIANLEAKARRDKHLDHYERLFLCSILTYTPSSIQYLHEILSQCSDYKFEVSQVHIEDWIARRERGIGGRPFSCQKAKSVGIFCGGCDSMEPKKKMVKVGQEYVETGELSSPSPIRFAYSSRKNVLDF